jgi:hypothetical protein
MFEQIIVPEALEPFLSFNDLKSIIVMNKEIRNKFLIVLHKRTMWDIEHLPRDWKCVSRLKLKWDNFEILPYFTNIKELKLIYNDWIVNEISYFPNSFPETLTSLHLGNHFHGKLDSLPLNLNRLVFGQNCKIRLCPGILPNNLKELIFGHFCNIRLGRGILPKNLKKLIFGIFCEMKLHKCVFPKSLDMIEFGTEFNEDLEPLCILDLKEIRLDRNYNLDIPKKLKGIVKFVS